MGVIIILTMKNNSDKRRKILFFLIAIILIFFMFNIYNYIINASGYNENEGVTIFGFKAYAITTDSMYPYLKKGDIAIINTNSEYGEGDVVTFLPQGYNKTITHRIIEYREQTGTYITKGDNNGKEDFYKVTVDDIIGKQVGRIPLLGNIVLIFKSLIVICYSLMMIIVLVLRKKRLDRKRLSRRLKKESECDKNQTRTYREEESFSN